MAWTRVLVTLALAACAVPDGLDTDEVDIEVGKADAEIRVRIDGLTVWIDPEVKRADGARPWRLGGRASRNLASVASFVPDDAFGETTIRSARTFEIALDDHELNSIASGMPLFVTITPTTGSGATAGVWLTSRLGSFSGTWRLRPDVTVTPRWVSGDVIYRGGARAEPGWLLTASGENAPQVFAAPEPERFRLDWTYATFAAGALAPIEFTVYKSEQTASKEARARFVTRRLGLTRLDPSDVWKQRCESAVRTCLESLPAGTVDAGSCGTYRQVEKCGGLELGGMPAPTAVAEDLRAHLVGYYEDNPDVSASGGNTLAQAQAAVDPGAFELVTEAEDDPAGHDLASFWVFRHPDVTFPGSDIAWFVVYDQANGALVEIYDFN